MDPREAKLPAWAQKLIGDMRLRIKNDREVLLRELEQSRPKIELLTRRNEALQELLECAARGGHKTAQDIQDIIGQYDLVLAHKE